MYNLKRNFAYQNTVTPFQMFVNSVKTINKHEDTFNIFLDKSVFNSSDFDHMRFVSLLEYLYHPSKEVHMTVILNDIADDVIKDILFHMTYSRGYLMIDNMVNQYVTANRPNAVNIKNILETVHKKDTRYPVFTLVLHYDKI